MRLRTNFIWNLRGLDIGRISVLTENQSPLIAMQAILDQHVHQDWTLDYNDPLNAVVI